MINRKLILLIAGTALSTGLSTAKAEDVYQLSLEQMDTVTAGVIINRNFTGGFGNEGFLFTNLRSEMREIQTESGIRTTNINVNSVGFRSFSGSIQRIGRFETTITRTRN
ncbi:MAG: hypothetical protein V3U88_10255 [Methylococcales bacterium]